MIQTAGQSQTREQCVGFARRWLCDEHGLVYGNVDTAADIWDKVSEYTRVADGKPVPVRNVVNGAEAPPRVGDLLVYGEKFRDTGHVAVVAHVAHDERLVEVLERNFVADAKDLPSPRRIPLIENGGRYWVLDGYLIGWKSLCD